MGRFAISVDIGGTFTDFVLLDEKKNTVVTAKVLSTPQQPDVGIFQGLAQLRETAGFDLADCDMFLHATTLITNSVIERKGHDFILLHTAGFGTTLETAREHRYNLTNLRLLFPKPISKRALKVAVQERVSAKGEILLSPDRKRTVEEVRRVVDATGVRNFAVCFLHSFPQRRERTGRRAMDREGVFGLDPVDLERTRPAAERVRALDDVRDQRLHKAFARRISPAPRGRPRTSRASEDACSS